jgi:hypothetical protein
MEEEKKIADERLKNTIDWLNELKDIEFEWQKERQAIAIDANRTQQQLLRKAAFELSQDFEQDFLGAFQKANQLAFDISETNIAAGQAFEDADIAAGLAFQQSTSNFNQTNNNQTVNIPGANTTLVNNTLQNLLLGS